MVFKNVRMFAKNSYINHKTKAHSRCLVEEKSSKSKNCKLKEESRLIIDVRV